MAKKFKKKRKSRPLKRFFTSAGETISPKGFEVMREFESKAQPFIDKYLDKGYSAIELEAIMIRAIAMQITFGKVLYSD